MKGFFAFFGAIGIILGCASSFYFRRLEFIGIIVLSAFCLILSFKKSPKIGLTYVSFFLIFAGLMSIQGNIKEGESKAYSGIVIEKKQNYYVLLSSFNRFYVHERDNLREVGDYVIATGSAKTYSSVVLESQFNFSEYLSKKGIIYELEVEEIEEKFNRPLRLSQRKIEFLSGLSDNAASLVDAICFSHLDYDSPLINEFASLSLLFVISGGGFLYGGFLRFLDKMLSKKLNKKVTKTIILIVGMILMVPLGPKPGLYRVFATRLIEFIYLLKNKNITKFESLSKSLFILLIMNRFYSLNQGFLIGYGCSLIFVLFGHIGSGKKKFSSKILSKILQTSVVFPLSTLNGGFHVLSIIGVIVICPIAMFYSLCGYICFIGIPIIEFLNGFADFIQKMLLFIKMIDFVIPISMSNFYFNFIYYCSIVSSLYFYEIGFRNISKIVVGYLTLLISLLCSPIGNGASQEVSFINVGQGDAILIRDGYKAMMIDTGGLKNMDIATEVDIPFLQKRNVYKLDYLIASHGDYDHIGGKDSLIKNFKVDAFIDKPDSFPLKFGSTTLINHNIFSANNENDRSLVLSMPLMGKVFLFTGDASSNIEEKIIDLEPSLDIDVLKVGHHGSKTSTCDKFLDVIKPDVAIISCGKNNRYGHPSKDVISRLENRGITIKRTDIDGTITFKKMIYEKTYKLISQPIMYNIKQNDYGYLFFTSKDGRKRRERID